MAPLTQHKLHPKMLGIIKAKELCYMMTGQGNDIEAFLLVYLYVWALYMNAINRESLRSNAAIGSSGLISVLPIEPALRFLRRWSLCFDFQSRNNYFFGQWFPTSYIYLKRWPAVSSITKGKSVLFLLAFERWFFMAILSGRCPCSSPFR